MKGKNQLIAGSAGILPANERGARVTKEIQCAGKMPALPAERTFFFSLKSICNLLNLNKTFWIKWDSTEYSVAQELLDARVTKEDIVLAFYTPEYRQNITDLVV